MGLRLLQAFQPPTGGVAEHVLLLSRGLVERGHELTVTGPADARCRRALEEAGIAYRALCWTGTVPDLRSDRAVRAELGPLIAGGGFDLVHSHGQKAGLIARPLAARHGLPALYSPHMFIYRTQMLRPRPGRRVRFLVNRAVERRLGRRTTMLVAVAQEEAAAAVSDGIVPPERATVVEHGVEPARDAAPHPELDGFRGEGPLFGFVSELREQKGVPILLDALQLLRDRGTPIRFAIVGNGPMRELVERRLESPGLAETVRLFRFEAGMESYLAALDVFVLPSIWEAMPIAVVEAMAAGLPVIASAAGGTPEAVTDGRTGLIVPPSDPEALAAAIARLAADADERRAMGRAGAEESARRFTVPRMIDRMEAVYEAVRAGAGAGRSPRQARASRSRAR